MLSSQLLLAILVFLLTAAVVVIASTFLTHRADAIADATGIGRVWIGSVMLAVATSLPELTTDVAAVRLHKPNLAIGDLFGSSLANMLILAILDLMPPRGRVFREAAFENTLGACLAILLTALAVVFVMERPTWTLVGITPQSLVLLLVYIGGTRAVYRNGIRKVEREPMPEEARAARKSLRRPLADFIGATVVIFVVAPMLAWSAGRIAVLTGLGTTFVGTWVVGLATSLPELVTAFAATRMGAFDLAVGDLFGSNAFNMVIFFALDAAQTGGSIFSVADPAHVISGTLGIVMTTLGLAGIVYRAERRYALIEPGSALMVVAYVLGILMLYHRVR